MYKLLSFDVYGTLMDTPAVSAKAFGRILADTRAPNIDPATFGGFREHYYEPYRSYKEIGGCRSTRRSGISALPAAIPI